MFSFTRRKKRKAMADRCQQLKLSRCITALSYMDAKSRGCKRDMGKYHLRAKAQRTEHWMIEKALNA